MKRLLLVVQLVLALRVALRLWTSRSGERISRSGSPIEPDAIGSVSVLVPVLNEDDRLAPCLSGLSAQPNLVREIIVADGGSTDGTFPVIERAMARDARVRPIQAGVAPEGANGKAHNLAAALAHADPRCRWVLTIDADVRPDPDLVTSLLAHARRTSLTAFSVATTQRIASAGLGLLHPSLLTTLVYRFGIPGRATSDPAAVQANGQCFLVEREALDRPEVGGFAALRDAVSEDVTLARNLAAAGIPVGFHEADDLVDVEMYASWREAWENWTRSLPMRDRHAVGRTLLGLAEVTAVQAAPPLVAAVFRRDRPLRFLNLCLIAMRLGVLAGTYRAYRHPPATYWLSPLCDLPVAIRLWLMTLRRRHTWRGRALVRGVER